MTIEQSLLLVIDLQTKLLPAMADSEYCLERNRIAVQAAAELGLDVVVSEQYPQGLGSTVPELAEALPGNTVIFAKTTFSCFGAGELNSALSAKPRRHIFISGIEAHVCVFQTALDAINAGYQVTVIADGVSSRKKENALLAFDELRARGARILPLETVLFELMRDAKHPAFRAVSKLIR